MVISIIGRIAQPRVFWGKQDNSRSIPSTKLPKYLQPSSAAKIFGGFIEAITVPPGIIGGGGRAVAPAKIDVNGTQEVSKPRGLFVLTHGFAVIALE